MYRVNKTGQQVDELLDKVDDFRPMTEQEAADLVHEVFGTD